MAEDVALEAIQRSVRPLPSNTAVDRHIIPDPSELGRMLCGRRSCRQFSGGTVPRQTIERVLLDCAGGVGYRSLTQEIEVLLRTIPQSGGISSVNAYLLLLRPTEHLNLGVYRLCAFTNSLHIVNQSLDLADVTLAFGLENDAGIGRAAGIIVITADLELKAFKYENRGYRYALIEVGCALQNALLSLHDQKVAAYPYGGFRDEALATLLKLAFPSAAPYVSVIFGTDE
jgi:SagB-type dehydrogenase family enzyme